MDDQEDADLSRLVEGLLLDVFLADEVSCCRLSVLP